MAKMKDLYLQIVDLYSQGFTITQIANRLQIPIQWVEDIVNTEGEYQRIRRAWKHD